MPTVKKSGNSNNHSSSNQNLEKIVEKAIKKNCVGLLEYMLGCMSVTERKRLVGCEQDKDTKEIYPSDTISKEDSAIISKHNYRLFTLRERLANGRYPVPDNFFETIKEDRRSEFLVQFYNCLSPDIRLKSKNRNLSLIQFALKYNKFGVIALLLDMKCHIHFSKQELNEQGGFRYTNFQDLQEAVERFLEDDVPQFAVDMEKSLDDYQWWVKKRDLLPEAIKDFFYDPLTSKQRLRDLGKLRVEVGWIRYSKRGTANLYLQAKILHEAAVAECEGKKLTSDLYGRVVSTLTKAEERALYIGAKLEETDMEDDNDENESYQDDDYNSYEENDDYQDNENSIEMKPSTKKPAASNAKDVPKSSKRFFKSEERSNDNTTPISKSYDSYYSGLKK